MIHYYQQLLSVFVTWPCVNRTDDALLSAIVISIRQRVCTMNRINVALLSAIVISIRPRAMYKPY